MQTLFDSFLSQQPWSGAQDFGRPIRAHQPGGLMDHEDAGLSIRPGLPPTWLVHTHARGDESESPRRPDMLFAALPIATVNSPMRYRTWRPRVIDSHGRQPQPWWMASARTRHGGDPPRCCWGVTGTTSAPRPPSSPCAASVPYLLPPARPIGIGSTVADNRQADAALHRIVVVRLR